MAQKPNFFDMLIDFFSYKIPMKRFEGCRKLFVGFMLPENQLKCTNKAKTFKKKSFTLIFGLELPPIAQKSAFLTYFNIFSFEIFNKNILGCRKLTPKTP